MKYVKVQFFEHCLHRSKEAPPEDVHISSLLLNANAHGRFCFVETNFSHEDNSSCIYDNNEDNDMHNEKQMSTE